MTKQPNKQKQPVATATSETEQPVFLQHAAAVCGVLVVTLRSWCKKKHIHWEHVKIGAMTRCLVRISDVRAYLAKRNPSAVGTAGSSPATPPQVETNKASQVTAAVPQEPVSRAAPDAPPRAPATVPTCVAQVESHQNTTETSSVAPVLNATVAVPQSTLAAKPAPSHPPTSRKQKTKPPHEVSLKLRVKHAKNSMRKFGAADLRKLAAWITQRLEKMIAYNANPASSEQTTPVS